MNFGQSIKIALVKAGMTQVEFAKRMGVNDRRVHAITKQRIGSLATLERAAKVFGMRPSELLALGEE